MGLTFDFVIDSTRERLDGGDYWREAGQYVYDSDLPACG